MFHRCSEAKPLFPHCLSRILKLLHLNFVEVGKVGCPELLTSLPRFMQCILLFFLPSRLYSSHKTVSSVFEGRETRCTSQFGFSSKGSKVILHLSIILLLKPTKIEIFIVNFRSLSPGWLGTGRHYDRVRHLMDGTCTEKKLTPIGSSRESIKYRSSACMIWRLIFCTKNTIQNKRSNAK